ncbi:MAG: CBS domain-containing protein [Elainellaceae cyanobacterium]
MPSVDPLVSEIMTPDPIMVSPDTPLREAIKLIADNRISGLPVVDENSHLIGVISETDLMWQETGINPPAYIMLLDSVIYLENPGTYERELHKALGQTVGEVMTKDVVTTSINRPLREAARIMHERKVYNLPVVDKNKTVVGILTRGDIVRHMAAHQDD